MALLSENTEMLKMKRNFDSLSRGGGDTINFDQPTRHNLLSDFDETPLKARKISTSSREKLSDSSRWNESSGQSSIKREMSLKDADIISLKASISKLQDRLACEEDSHRLSQIQHDKEVMRMKAERERSANKMGEMHSKLNYIMEQERSVRDALIAEEKKSSTQQIEMDKRLQAAQKEKREIEDRAQEQREKWHETESNLHDQIIQQKKEIINLESQYSETKAQLLLRERRDSSNAVHAQEVDELKRQLKVAQDKVKSLENQLSDHADDLVVTKALKSDLDLMPKMKSDLEKLRLDNEQLRYNEQNCLLLEEEVRGLKLKLERAKEESKRVVELEVANEELQGRLHRWEAYDDSGSRRPQSPCSLSRRISQLEASQAEQSVKEGELQTQVNSANYKLQQAQKENLKLSTDLQSEKSTASSHADLIKRLRRKILLITKERDSYKELLDSYESEVTINVDAQQRAQRDRQDSIIQEYKKEVATLEAEVARLSDKFSTAQDQADNSQLQLQVLKSTERNALTEKLEQELRCFKEKAAELEVELMKVQGQHDVLEARIEQRHLQGDYDPSKTKVLHIEMNPSAKAQQKREQELEHAQTEAERLKKRLDILEENGGAVQDLTMQVDQRMEVPSPSKEIKELKELLERSEMKITRFKEIFKKTSQELREACYELTGYKIDITCHNQYKLTNMYAQSHRDYLLFQQKNGEIQMLETDFSKTKEVQDSLDTYLKRQRSIPMFLSSLTMDLFSQQTMM